ncbi:MAG: alpha/beta hydrolase [Sphingomonadaceae bacterium]|nr:alpha/beta hydrolase [Sphingomonadaceae bacterium]
MMRSRPLAVAFSAIALLAVPAGVATASEPAAIPYIMPEAETWDMTSGDGQVFRISVSRPAAPAPEGGYPVLYVLDGNAMFAGFAEARRIHGFGTGGIDKMIVVGVGHPGDQIYDSRRMFDFTAPIETPALKRAYAGHKSGGRDRFLKFLLDELRPAIGKRYSVDPHRQSLYGHSLGGLFALHVLYSRPGAFRTIIATSPSIWWDDQSILAEEQAFRARVEKDPALGRTSRLLLMAGALEDGTMAADAGALAKRMEALSAYGLRVEYMLLDDETHISVPSRSVTASLRAAASRR